MTGKTEKVTVHARPARETAVAEGTFVPLVDIYEADDEGIVLAAEVPGAAKETIDVRVDKGVLTVEAEAPLGEVGEGYTVTYRGFSGGQYFRAFALSDEIDRDKIEASLADGVLTLRLPRAAAAKTRKIEIKGL
ncbi:MAG: Hsp20/alpha crystallin family protein [Phycisphaerae bacterium]|nr:Hsp20/alpha crystallin family protein [Phycisphaerae bacterium]